VATVSQLGAGGAVAVYTHLKETGGAVNAAILADITSGAIGVGDVIQTASYYDGPDAGGCLYRVVAAATGTDDGGRFVDAGSLQLRAIFTDRTISVAQFGARCNGTTDDTTAINAAIAYLNTLTGGQSVQLTWPGRSLVSAVLTPFTRNNVTLIGPGRGAPAVIVANTITAGSGYILTFDPGGTAIMAGLTIRDFVIQAQTQRTPQVHGFRFIRVHQSHFASIRAHGLVGMGLHATNCWDNDLVGGFFSQPGQAAGSFPSIRFDAEDLLDDDSGCNNWDLVGITFEGHHWRAMEWRKWTRRMRMSGKFHGTLPTPVVTADALVLSGAYGNFIGMVNFGNLAADSTHIVMDIEDGQASSHNSITACSFQTGGRGVDIVNGSNNSVDASTFGTDLTLALGSGRVTTGTANRWGPTNRAVAAPTGGWTTNFGGIEAASIADPTAATSATSRQWVEAAIAAGDTVRVRAVATTAINTATPPATIDGVTMAAGDLVLLTAQGAASNNGIYTYPVSGAMLRATAFDTAAELQNKLIVVTEGGNRGAMWQAPATVTLGSAITYTRLTAPVTPYTWNGSAWVQTADVKIYVQKTGDPAPTGLGANDIVIEQT